MKKKETILCHTFIGTVPLVIGKKFLFESEGQSPRRMCVVKDCPAVYMGRFLHPGYEVVDCVSGFILPHGDNIAHNAPQKKIIESFFAEMRKLGVQPDGIASVVENAMPEDVKGSASELSALPSEVKENAKRIYGVCL
jgi:hypothetical protein